MNVFYCPIAKGCAWCTVYNYQVTRIPDGWITYICEMYKVRALTNVCYWNKQGVHMDLFCPEEWVLNIISKEEYETLKELTGGFKENPHKDKLK